MHMRASKPSAGKRRTHMMFGSAPEKEYKRIRRATTMLGLAATGEKFLKPSQQLQAVLQEKDVAVQTVSQLDPRQWTGNQRVIHFGPAAQRDPFYYYYPKGWDILYPAHFGFFPYRTKKSRGSRPLICLTAFGSFFSIAGSIITYLSYASMFAYWKRNGNWDVLQISGPTVLSFGLFLLLLGFMWWIFTSQLCNEKLRHTQPHHIEPRKIFVKKVTEEDVRSVLTVAAPCSPFTPPPPIAVLENYHTEAACYKPISEMKLYPPMMPGATSTLATTVGASHCDLATTFNSPMVFRDGNHRSAYYQTAYNHPVVNANLKKAHILKRQDSAASYDYEAWPAYHASKMASASLRSYQTGGR